MMIHFNIESLLLESQINNFIYQIECHSCRYEYFKYLHSQNKKFGFYTIHVRVSCVVPGIDKMGAFGGILLYIHVENVFDAGILERIYLMILLSLSHFLFLSIFFPMHVSIWNFQTSWNARSHKPLEMRDSDDVISWNDRDWFWVENFFMTRNYFFYDLKFCQFDMQFPRLELLNNVRLRQKRLRGFFGSNNREFSARAEKISGRAENIATQPKTCKY